ncbi:crossover junction endodeoxyribonuclease RuvC [Candidatus Falkowbacteria bacterium]|jgi:crossover junction endodeoxyribonuclease RuvC|nr:crossover junction endodeoxyribonuclease RuvC [Candidatus Falkowbacteria bacterium]
MSKVILGIDPGYGRTGYGVIESEGSKLTSIDYGVIETSSGDEFLQRLKDLHKELQKIIKKHNPDLIAVEDLFFYNNAKTAIKVGQARGVILLTAVNANIQVHELTPLQVKQGICGYGQADKLQVQKMVKTVLNLKTIPKPDDAADALAIAVCASSVKLIKL